MRRKPINLNCLVGYSSIGLLGLLLLALLLPHTPSSSSATSCLDDPTIEGCYTTMAETEVGVTASTAISLAMSSQVNMEVIPKSNGATSSASTKLSVSTNSPDGYALYMQTGSTSGDLVSTATLSESKITNTTKSNVTLSNLEPNAYGYALTEGALDSSTTYSSLPTTGSVIKKTTSVTASEGNYAYGDTYNLAFGVNVSTTLPAGTYTGSVLVSAVANPKTIATMFDLTYMQDMTSDICTNTREGYTKQLIDTRDGKSYWVAKLKDGNCWMTQNLALDLDVNEQGNAVAVSEIGNKVELNAGNTDINNKWGQSSVYAPTKTSTLIPTDNTGVDAKSWSFGKNVILTPLTPFRDSDYGTLIPGGGTLADVSIPAMINVEGWSPTFIAQSGSFIRKDFVRKTSDAGEITWVPRAQAEDGGADKDEAGNYIFYTYSGFIPADIEAKTYDTHYLLGNYYRLSTATAGSANLSVVANIDESICAKGWKLPTGLGTQTDYELARSTDKSYSKLLQDSGFDLWTWTGVVRATSPNNAGISVRQSPLYILGNGKIVQNGIDAFTAIGYLITDRVIGINRGETYYGTSGLQLPADFNQSVNYGMNVRCVAR